MSWDTHDPAPRSRASELHVISGRSLRLIKRVFKRLRPRREGSRWTEVGGENTIPCRSSTSTVILKLSR